MKCSIVLRFEDAKLSCSLILPNQNRYVLLIKVVGFDLFASFGLSIGYIPIQG